MGLAGLLSSGRLGLALVVLDGGFLAAAAGVVIMSVRG